MSRTTPHTVTAGLDGSPESLAAAEWAAREAELRGLPLELVHVWQPAPDPLAQAPLLGAETLQHWSERVPREALQGLRQRHPDLPMTAVQRTGAPGDALAEAAKDAALLVLGSRGLSGVGGFLVGSVGMAVVARTEQPVVLVRAGEQATDTHVEGVSGAAPFRPVVLGLDAEHPDDSVIGFAFDAAVRRGTALRVVHGWNLPSYYVYGLAADPEFHQELARPQADALTAVLGPWRDKFPSVEVVEECLVGSPATHLVDASRRASLVVVGRRIRRSAMGAHIGPVTHAVLHHATSPVAVVAHS